MEEKQSFGKHLLSSCLRSQAPLSGVGVSLHDDSLDLGHDSVVARGHRGRRHHRDGQADGLALGSHNHDLLVDFNAILVPDRKEIYLR